jgi:glycosyltransferase involved in cell wall biosynthesis
VPINVNPLPLTVAVVTLNEEANLPRLLASIDGLASEIVVVDSGSTDGTERIAKAAGARWETAKWEGFIMQKNRSLDFCTQPWILFLDADEALSPELADALRRLFESGDPAGDGYEINRRTWYLGDWIWHAICCITHSAISRIICAARSAIRKRWLLPTLRTASAFAGAIF